MAARSPSRPRPRHRAPPGFFGRLLDPIDRLSETIFSLLILLTFTLTYRVALHTADPEVLHSAEYSDGLLLTAFGAILAWGIIDGVMYALIEVFQRGERHRLLRQVQAAESEQDAVAAIADEFDHILEPITGEAERQTLYRNVYAQLLTSRPRPVGFTRDDFTGAVGCVVVAVLAVLPSLAPLAILRDNFDAAIRVSNLVSFAMLFAAGYSWGLHTGSSPWRSGLVLVAVGALMVAVALPLGG
jgi:VIT1/CCC1 family predicted Fe2+/Mn2+ transporter